MNPIDKWNPFRAPALWDPIRELEDMQNRLSSLLGRRLPLLRDAGEEEFTVTEWSPPVDIAEDDKEYTLKAELPGMSKENIKVSVDGGVLSITGERKAEKEEKNKNTIASSGATEPSPVVSRCQRMHQAKRLAPTSRMVC
jgi:HSP20 family protein